MWRSVHGFVACGPTAEPVSERAMPPTPLALALALTLPLTLALPRTVTLTLTR